MRVREAVLGTARTNGFGTSNSGASHAGFDAELGTLFGEMPLLSSGEALRNHFWTFVGVSLAPDVVYWRFGEARERYLGGVRNTFQRMWLRARAFGGASSTQSAGNFSRNLRKTRLLRLPSGQVSVLIPCWPAQSQRHGSATGLITGRAQWSPL